MEPSPQTQHSFFTRKAWPFLMLALGLFRLAGWLQGGRQDPAFLLAAAGFALLAAGTAIRSPALPARSVAWRRLGMALALLGLALVLVAIALRHLGPSGGDFPLG
ncbi:hypothetical protein [Frateuria terrea]|uniref:Uncharacterized protein n=1 Tax=Frateuria terrea TaxID=529704 RepID=A0A1H6YVF6_9GAMM|nr:hypothetical protein [Frateuria terrea]SEJ41332.1 hypothetical protein SAMN04487997_3260 [Frateuria terrea]SFP74388.1 hypothetical protein SAMN02927913_3423 [Frateuria terrea]